MNLKMKARYQKRVHVDDGRSSNNYQFPIWHPDFVTKNQFWFHFITFASPCYYGPAQKAKNCIDNFCVYQLNGFFKEKENFDKQNFDNGPFSGLFSFSEFKICQCPCINNKLQTFNGTFFILMCKITHPPCLSCFIFLTS